MTAKIFNVRTKENLIGKYFLFLSLCCFFISAQFTFAFTQNNSSSDTLALIGNKVITSENYISSYKNKLVKLGLTDNFETRKGYLLNIVQDEVLIREAYESGLDKTVESQNELKRIQVQELLNVFSDNHISPKINITDNELKDLFVKVNTKVKVRHLYASSKEEAGHLYNQLLDGKTFEELAQNIFQDQELKESGGLIGYITVDEMDPDFERAAYALNVGEISKPVKTVQGYSIIKVEDKISNPFVTQSEFLKAYDKLKAFARKRAYEELTKEFSQSLSTQLNVQFDEKNVSLLYEYIKRGFIGASVETSFHVSEYDLDKIFVTSTMGSWNIKRATNELNAISEKQKKWIRTEENLKDFIAGLINREYILQKAKEEKLDELTSYKENVRENFDSYLLSIVENKIIEKIKIPGDSVKAFYAGNSKLFTSPPEIKLSSILLDDKIISDSIKVMLVSGVDFALLARKYSIQKIPAERGGDIGYYKKEELENFGDEIFRMKKDEWIGPLSFERKFLFVKCTGYKQPSVKSLEESYGDIERWLANAKWYKEKDKYVDSLKKKIETKIFPDKLTKIKI